MSNQIKKTNAYRDSLAWEIKGIRKKWRIQEAERMQLLKTLSGEEINAIEKKRISKVSEEWRKLREEKKTGKEYIENKEKYIEYKGIAKKLSAIMKISRQEARDLVKNLDTITEGNKWFMENFMQAIMNLVKWQTPLAKNIEKTRKEKEALEAKIKQIQWKWEISETDKTNLSKLLGEDELALINQMRWEKTSNELEKFLEKEKNRKEKLEKSYQEQQELINSIAELLDISENEVVSVLQHLNIEWEKEEKIAEPKKEKPKKIEVARPEKTKKENSLRKHLEKTVKIIHNNGKRIAVAAAIITALGLWYQFWKEYIKNWGREKQEQTIAENKIMRIDTVKVPGYKEKNDTLTVKEFIKSTGSNMDADTLTILPYPWEKLNEYSYIDDHYIKDKDQVIFYYNRWWNERFIKIDWADPESFVSINGWFATDKYAKDKNNVYRITFDTKQIDEATTQDIGEKLIILKDADPSTFTVLSDDYTKDSKSVYYQWEIITADAESFECLGLWGIGKDKNFVYHWKKLIANIDAETFACIDKNWYLFADKNWVYYGTTLLKWIDRHTVEKIGKNMIKDKNGKYFITRVQRKSDKEREAFPAKI